MMKGLRSFLFLVGGLALAVFSIGFFGAGDVMMMREYRDGMAASVGPSAPGEFDTMVEKVARGEISRDEFRAWMDGQQHRDAQVEDATEQFKRLPINYNKPTQLDYQKANRIILSIGSASQPAALKRAESGTGQVVTKDVMLSGRVEASLDGPRDLVDIQLGGAPGEVGATRDVTRAGNATWTWYVTPKTLDEVTLTLTLYNEVEIDGKPVRIEREAYHDRFTIRASTWDRWSGFLDGFWVKLVAAVTLVAGLVGIWYQLREMRAKGKGPAPVKPVPARPRKTKKADQESE